MRIHWFIANVQAILGPMCTLNKLDHRLLLASLPSPTVSLLTSLIIIISMGSIYEFVLSFLAEPGIQVTCISAIYACSVDFYVFVLSVIKARALFSGKLRSNFKCINQSIASRVRMYMDACISQKMIVCYPDMDLHSLVLQRITTLELFGTKSH